MKNLLNPKLQKEKMIEIKECSSEEENQYIRIEGMISKSLESIEENIISILDIPINKFIDKVKKVVFVVSEEIRKKHSCVEEDMEGVHNLNCKGSEEEHTIPLPEISTKKHINKEVDDLDETMQNGEET